MPLYYLRPTSVEMPCDGIDIDFDFEDPSAIPFGFEEVALGSDCDDDDVLPANQGAEPSSIDPSVPREFVLPILQKTDCVACQPVVHQADSVEPEIEFDPSLLGDLEFPVLQTSGRVACQADTYVCCHGVLRLWTAGQSTFTYDEAGRLNGPLSARDVNVFVTSRGWDGVDRSMDITIQRCPEDMSPWRDGRPECLFKECPLRREGMHDCRIQPGEYMFAFDELIDYRLQSSIECDPWQVSGYAHVYCAERWLDFPALCMIADLNIRPGSDYPPFSHIFRFHWELEAPVHDAVQAWLAHVRQTFIRPSSYPTREQMSEVILGEYNGTLASLMHSTRRSAAGCVDEVECADSNQVPLDLHMGNLEVYYAAMIMRTQGESKIGTGRRRLFLNAMNEMMDRTGS